MGAHDSGPEVEDHGPLLLLLILYSIYVYIDHFLEGGIVVSGHKYEFAI